jgi:hypothetical protein
MKPWASTAPAPLFHPDQSSAEIATIQKDVKNADRSGDVYENKGRDDKLTGDFLIFNGHFRQKCRILSICERKSVKKQVSGAAELAAGGTRDKNCVSVCIVKVKEYPEKLLIMQGQVAGTVCQVSARSDRASCGEGIRRVSGSTFKDVRTKAAPLGIAPQGGTHRRGVARRQARKAGAVI